jgi:protease-4
VYAEGSITDGNSEGGGIGGDTYSAMIRKIREDDDVKAIVLRINSGGGSSLASEIIWRELQLCREAGKPIIVSMGDVAASGGYYIACNATKILAEPNTITGSIGVFGLIPNAGGFLRDKLGVTYDTIKTGKYSVALSGNPYYEFSEDEGKIIQGFIDTTYHDFLFRVATGRKMKIADVDSLAQGRVCTGKKALALGLVDSLGGLQDAINIAAKTASLKKYRLAEYPASKTGIERLVTKLKGGSESSAQAAFMKQQLGDELYQQYKQVQIMRTMKGIQMRLPFMLNNW